MALEFLVCTFLFWSLVLLGWYGQYRESVAYHKSTTALYNAVGQAHRDKDELVIEPAPFMMPIEPESDDPFWDGLMWADLD